ncbi:chondroitin sulfate proteoglycan 4 isoform X2 [Octodon degus]|uniref:Chondroitin sulfate proteoglycan 4 isoform X2 n=1 Tax=Octodon degus TaxID=10160 RepID=A0A6P6DX80_OCTDE|nr:chondroitin sulfate proteoglycan 4 isoform X2 [Octodon degus]
MRVPGARRLLLLSACLGLCGALGASFYGESYVELNNIEVSSELSLQLKFQTSKSQGLLFLAAGKNDYCIVELQSGNLWARVNLGAGEQVLVPARSLPVDDLVWHLVELYRIKEKVFLVIDNHETSGQVAGGVHNFSFQHGIYIGGHGGLSIPYLDGRVPNFRGCMEDVVFNHKEILPSLRSYPGFKQVHEVSLGCSEEFFTGEDEAINFFSSRSYVTFPEWKVQGGGVLEFALQTGAQQALILFQSGKDGDFVALEIHEGRLKAQVGRNKSKTELSSFIFISDTTWHAVQLQVTGGHLGLVVDEQAVRTLLPLQSKPLISQGPLFVGGLDNQIREEVKMLGLASVPRKSPRGISLKGCLQGLEANSQKRALREALASKDISAGCNSKSTGNTNLSVTTLTNPPRSEAFYSTTVPGAVKSFLQEPSSSFLVLNSLEVQEGGRAQLEQKHVQVNMEFKDLVFNYSQLLFKIEESPLHGLLQLDVSSEQEVAKMFTMLDVWQGKVWYVHGGAEEYTDSFTFLLSSNSKKEMPFSLQDHEPFMFNISVIPVNDPPHLRLPNGNMLLVLENAKKRLTPSIVQVSDPDTDALSLSFSVLGNFDSDAGFLENVNDPGRAINGFQYRDLRDGNIFFVHHGPRNSRIILRASDGRLASNTVVLRVLAVPWDFKVANRTGVVVQQGGTVLITQSNLSVEVSGDHRELETHYDITQLPQFGQIQRWGSRGEWKQVSSFSQRSINKNRIRYYSTFEELQQKNVTDHFKFRVNVEGKVSKELVFPVTVQWLKFILVKNIPLEISTMNKAVLSSDHLQAATEGVDVAEREIHFKLLTPPKKGKLLLDNEVLKTNSIFSQKNITDTQISYEPQQRPKEDSQDTFRFLIVAKHIESKDYSFRILLKAHETGIILTNRGLIVKEGEGKLITKSELFIQTWENQIFRYQVTKSPQHGRLTLMGFSDTLESNGSITTFTDEDIVGERLMYIHDDSETRNDEFFVVPSLGQEGEVRDPDVQHLPSEIKVNISVELRNDERPVRMVDKVFHVVRNSQRLLTLADLYYHDPDVDFDDGQLLYTRRGIPNGDLVRAGNPTEQLYQFTQEDLREGRVLFRHQGADSARFVLFVTDGVHYTPSLLEVAISDPYVQIENNTGLLVQRGMDSLLTAANLSVSTNQDIRTDLEVEFLITRPPKHGTILVNNSTSLSFSQHDLKQGRVTYRHNGSGHADIFNLTVKVKDAHLEVGVCVQVEMEDRHHWGEVGHRRILVVEEGKPVKLSRGKLQAGSEHGIPPEAAFRVRAPPAHGYLQRSVPEEGSLSSDEKFPLSFTQQDVDDGNILYVQTAPAQRQDRFFLDVVDGSQVVSEVEIVLDIVPKLIPLEVQNLTVREGGSAALLEEHLKIPSKYFEGLDCEFVLLEPPKHGHVENIHVPGVKLMKFTRKQVENESIFYVHDDSETLLDNFTVFANSSELGKRSRPQTLFVTVESVNDEAPVITANNVLQVWSNSVTEITSGNLCAEDGDSSLGELVYQVAPPSNGHLALKSSPDHSIQNFTQAQINEGLVVFAHSGSAKPLSPQDLKVVTNDAGNRTVTFRVLSSPRLGRLLSMNSDNCTEDVSTFTQHLVSEGLILYQHTDQENAAWTMQDSFTFVASSPPAAVLGPEEFFITISYEINEPGRHSHLLANTGAAVKEGDKVLIDRSKLDASNLLFKLPKSQRSSYEVWFQVLSLPHHGTIMVGERNITAEKPNFSQFIINKFGVTYLHDDSESLTDNFTFAAWPNKKSTSATKPEAGFLEELFNITIAPVNDQAPELKTKGLRLQVRQGNSLVVRPEILKVEDPDSPPDEIRYTIIRHPNNGFLSLANHSTEPFHQFTQADVDSHQVWFTQDGSPSSGVFYFSVTDGKHRPLYKLFHLDVVPTSIALVNLSDLCLPQGQTAVTVTSAHLLAVTNGRSPQITYRITGPPQHGHLLLENQVVTSFGQEDVDSGRLSYHMTDLTAAEDQLQFSVFTSESNLTGQRLGIRVQPQLRVASELKVTNRVAHQLRREDLDASELANITNSDPTFEVTEPPVHGRLVRRVVHSMTMDDARLFTQKDVDQGLLVLDVLVNLTGTDALNDSFTFLLRADYVQPAIGHLPFTIVPRDPLLLQTFTPAVPPVTGENHMRSVFSPQKPIVSSGFTTQTEMQGRLTQARWKGTDSWEPRSDVEPHVDSTVSPMGVMWPPAAAKVSPRAPSQPRESNYPLVVTIPLAVAFFLLIVILVTLCIWLLGRKEEKPKPLINLNANLEPITPSYEPERSTTVPSVTVTPLIQSSRCPPASLFKALQCEETFPTMTEPVGKCAPWESWGNLDPNMVRLCRQTHPTLKHNQYWV